MVTALPVPFTVELEPQPALTSSIPTPAYEIAVTTTALAPRSQHAYVRTRIRN